MSHDPLDQAAFQRLADMALNLSDGEQTQVSMADTESGTTRFANNNIIQNLNSRWQTLTILLAYGQQHGKTTTTDLSDQSIKEAVQRAQDVARWAPTDPEYLVPLSPQTYAAMPTFRPETKEAGLQERVDGTKEAIDICREENLQATGFVRSSVGSIGHAASTGLFAYEQRTHARFSLTAIGADSTGWVDFAHRSINELAIPTRTRVAVSKSQQSGNPKEIPPGRYMVILAPAAVAGLVAPLIESLDAKDYDKGTSPLAGKLEKSIIDLRLTLQNRPDHPDLLGSGFDEEGLPASRGDWIQQGVLRQLLYDRYMAKEKGVPPSGEFDAPVFCGQEATGEDVQDLIRQTEKGILVTNFWYIRFANVMDMTLTGMTRDGTFLVEDGRIACGLRNFRFHDSPLRAFNALEGFTPPMDAITPEQIKMLLPAMKIRDFHFSSVTRF